MNLMQLKSSKKRPQGTKKARFRTGKRAFKLVGGIGLEHNPEKTPEDLTGKELSNIPKGTLNSLTVQNPVHILQKNPELIQVVDSWPDLPDHIKQTIQTLIGSVTVHNNLENIK